MQKLDIAFVVVNRFDDYVFVMSFAKLWHYTDNEGTLNNFAPLEQHECRNSSYLQDQWSPFNPSYHFQNRKFPSSSRYGSYSRKHLSLTTRIRGKERWQERRGWRGRNVPEGWSDTSHLLSLTLTPCNQTQKREELFQSNSISN